MSDAKDALVCVSASTPRDNSHLAINLRVLSKLKAEDKLSRSGPYLVIDPCAVWTPLLRYLRADNRAQMVTELEALYRDSIRVISDPAVDTNWSSMMRRLVSQSLQGVAVLRQTYHADATVVARLEHVLELARGHVPKEQRDGDSRSF